MSEDELRGRLAAVELIVALALNGAGRQWASSAWPNYIAQYLDEALAALLPTLPNDVARSAARGALTRMFERSAHGFTAPG